MRYAVHRKDAAEALIVDALEKAGWLTAQWGSSGAPDRVCFHPGRNLIKLVEIKTPKTQYGNQLRPTQSKFKDKGWPVVVIRTPEEAVLL